MARRWAKLDRCLVNLDWSSKCNSYTLKHLSRIFSDHAPLLLAISFNYNRRFNLFCFNNYWLDYIGYHIAIRKIWNSSPNGNPMHASHTSIKNWCRSGLNPLDSDIINTENDIASLEISDTFDADTQPHLEELYAKFAVLQRQNLSKWAQRAHLQWVCDGDRNSKFLHNVTRIRKHFNSISHVSDLNSNLFSDRDDIENVFLNFYSQLWSNPSEESFVDILNALPSDLPQLSSFDCDFLVRNITRKEVHTLENDCKDPS